MADFIIAASTPGLFGLYVSCIMSATLSTLSSGMNSMAAAVYEDFLRHRVHGKITDAQATTINKALFLLIEYRLLAIVSHLLRSVFFLSYFSMLSSFTKLYIGYA